MASSYMLHPHAEAPIPACHHSGFRAGGDIILSFDVEEHFRIEAATGLALEPALKDRCCDRLEFATRWILDQLCERDIKATFFVVGELTRRHGALIRAMARDGHEVASHSWDHRRLHRMSADTFREDLRQSQDALEQVTGQPVVGFRAPTFSIVQQTAWAVDVLLDLGFLYDSSVFPVWHDRYGVPEAPRGPFRLSAGGGEILEFPPVTLRMLGMNLPVGGGGYFRLFPLLLQEWALAQAGADTGAPVATFYFHPWEFDRHQPRLPLKRLSGLRTYLGIFRNPARFLSWLSGKRFSRAMDVAQRIETNHQHLPRFALCGDET